MSWQTVIGLEVHAQLKTNSKLFSGSATTYGASPNSQTSFIDAGLPGVLPVLNQKAVYMAIQFGLAIGAEINNFSFFERKNYFYPDLPKGYQISQFQHPIVSNGHLEIVGDDDTLKKVMIVRAHLEEDAGKLLHDTHTKYTGIDLNRAGTPLLEIVTAPCLFSAKEAIHYLKNLHQLLRFLDICDGNMQEGSFRCDVNLSLRPRGQKELGVRTELKNLNSFRFIEKAIQYEEQRHQDCLETGQQIIQETRLYSPEANRTEVLRTKENENDYRYFPDPDLLPIEISETDLNQIKATLPELPTRIKQRLYQEGLSGEDIEFLLATPATLQLYDDLHKESHAPAKLIINWLKGPYAATLKEKNRSFDEPLISLSLLGCLLDRLADDVIPSHIAKTIFHQLLKEPKPIDELIKASGYEQQRDSSVLEKLVRELIAAHPQQAADYRAGKEKLLTFFVGQIMKQTKGQFNPNEVNALVKACLKG